MRKAIPVSQLNPGDILLYRGSDVISRAVMLFDASEVSHAGLFLGRTPGMGRSVAEALPDGLVRRELERSIEGFARVGIRRLKEMPGDLSPVLRQAHTGLQRGERCAGEPIVLLALLILAGSGFETPGFDTLARSILDAASSRLMELRSAGREALIASEFVFHAYDDAFPDSIRIRNEDRKKRVQEAAGRLQACCAGTPEETPGPAPGAAASLKTAVQQLEAYFSELGRVERKPKTAGVFNRCLEQRIGAFAVALYGSRHPGIGEISRADACKALAAAVSGLVTPGDLQRSGSLTFMGTLKT